MYHFFQFLTEWEALNLVQKLLECFQRISFTNLVLLLENGILCDNERMPVLKISFLHAHNTNTSTHLPPSIKSTLRGCLYYFSVSGTKLPQNSMVAVGS